MDDSQIIRLYWDRDEKAIPATADKYGAYCAAIARNIVRDPQDAEECVNDTYLKAWNSSPPGLIAPLSSIPPQRPASLTAYLGRITRNLAFNRYRRDSAEKRGGGELPAVLDELAECVSGGEDPAEYAEVKDLMESINGFLATLSNKNRSIFVSRYWYARSLSEIALCHGMKEGAVTMALSRMRSRLRRYLEERGHVI